MSDCIFCKIINREIPCHKIYENQYFLAIMDINPSATGHVLAISKTHARNLFELPEDFAAHFLPFVQKVARAVYDETGAEGVNLLQNNGACAGQSVFHFHAHIIPRKKNDEIPLAWAPMRYKPSSEELADMAKRLIDKC